ncbi:MAG: 2-amino-4-hydroxy-6-hydroxymethyldihydropteridine diphosphokinase [Acidobacteriota bacterium]
MRAATEVAIALGSNLGDRRAHLEWALGRLRPHLSDFRVSSIVETDPVDVPGPQPPYLNAALVGRTELEPEPLLDLLMSIERERGRERPSVRAPRTLDLDLILYGDRVVHTPGMDIPHPRFRDRRFVLEPLAEIAPEMRDPETGRTVSELLQSIGNR